MIWAAWLAMGCIYKQAPDTTLSQDNELPEELGVLAVVPAQLMSLGAQDPYREGVFVGNVVLSGGYVQEEVGDYGLQTHSVEVELGAQETYSELALSFADQAIEQSLSKRGQSWQPVELTLGLPEQVKVRGSHPEDGHDNVNLPRFTLAPPQLAEAAVEADHLLAVWVVNYYSHNAGWFYGQHMGSKAGARARVFWVVYDLQTRSPVAWADVDSRYLYDKVFQPNSAQTEDAMIAVEAQLSEGLERSLR